MWMLFVFSACDGGAPPGPAPTRGDAAAPPPKKQVTVADFCETEDKGPFVWPDLAEGPPPPDAEGWRWVNVWATWCKPCVAEMPMLTRWQKRLAEAGVVVDLSFLSVDDGPVVVDDFYKAHPELPKGRRIKSVELVSQWLPKIGLDASAMLPLHVFVDPQHHIRCEKMGSLGEGDFEAVKALLTSAQ